MSFKFRNLEKIVGLFTLMGLVILLITIILLGQEQRWFAEKITLKTVFDTGEGLAKGMQVKLNGLEIGRSTDIRFTTNNQIEVSFTVYEEYINSIDSDSYVFRESTSPLGGSYLKLTLGTRKGHRLKNGSYLLSQDSDHVQTLLANGVIPQHSSSLNKIIKNINQLTGQLAAPRGPLFSTLRNLKQLTAKMSSDRGTMHYLFTDSSLYNEIMQTIAALNKVAINVQVLSSTIRETSPNIRNIILDAEQGMNDTTKILNSLQRYFTVTTPSRTSPAQEQNAPLAVIKTDRREER